MSEAKNEMSVEERKQAALAAKEAKKADADAEKAAKADAKAKEVETTVSNIFVTIQENTTTGKSVLAALTDQSTPEDVKTAGESAGNYLKSAKAGLKDIRTHVRKVKDAEERGLAQAVVSAEGLVNDLQDSLSQIKTKVSEAKKAERQAEKEKRDAEKAAAKAANAMPQQNGVTRPRPDTACGKAWEMFDTLTAKLGQTVPIAIAIQGADKEGLVYDTVKTQYARWKKFNGVEGRVAMPVPEGLF